MSNIVGTEILIIGGRSIELIDNIRFYSNYGRPESHGLRTALKIAKLGGNVCLINAGEIFKLGGKNIKIIDHIDENKLITTTQDLLNIYDIYSKSNKWDIIINLANTPNFVPSKISTSKLKLKNNENKKIIFEVKKNIDLYNYIKQKTCENTIIMGYDNKHNYCVSKDDETTKEISKIIEDELNEKYRENILPIYTQKKNNGKKIIINAGATFEKITIQNDIISNLSSGIQGIKIAESFNEAGFNVILIISSISSKYLSNISNNIKIIYKDNAQEMLEECIKNLPADIFIGVAAIADFKPCKLYDVQNWEEESQEIEFLQNPDVIYEIANHSYRPNIVIGFAAESDNLIQYATNKLQKKNLNAICANLINKEIKNLGTQNNKIYFITKNQTEELKIMSKKQIGDFLVNYVNSHLTTTHKL